jgi:hypothetical protein
MIPKFNNDVNFSNYNIKKGSQRDPFLLFSFYETQPMVGAVRATGVASTAARSRGKL